MLSRHRFGRAEPESARHAERYGEKVSDTYSGGRPAGVTILAILTIFIGAINIISGLLIIISRTSPEIREAATATESTLLALGIIYIVIGAVYLLVSRGLWRGSNASRILITIVSAIHLAAGIWLLTQSSGSTRAQAT